MQGGIVIVIVNSSSITVGMLRLLATDGQMGSEKGSKKRSKIVHERDGVSLPRSTSSRRSPSRNPACAGRSFAVYLFLNLAELLVRMDPGASATDSSTAAAGAAT